MTKLSSDSELERAEGTAVCVVDASSYVGMWIVKGLLQRGYTVHAAVQVGGDSEALRRIRDERLKMFTVDMLDYHSIANAVKSCSGLFYTFDHPQNAAGYDELTVEIEVGAAHNVVEACAHTQTIEKLVFTSSVAAAVWGVDRNSSVDLNERHWSDASFCKKSKLWFALAKTLSERTAWALAMDRGVNLVTINAALVVGPGFTYKTSGSTISYLKGAAQMYEDGTLASVDVKYLVDAQICAFEDPSAFGRYICFNQIINSAEDAVKLAQSLRPLVSFPERCEDSRTYKKRLSNEKLNGLMVGFGRTAS